MEIEYQECPRCHQMRPAKSFTTSYVPNICYHCYEKWCGNCSTVNDHVLSESPCVECGQWTYAGWSFETEAEMEEWADHEFDDFDPDEDTEMFCDWEDEDSDDEVDDPEISAANWCECGLPRAACHIHNNAVQS